MEKIIPLSISPIFDRELFIQGDEGTFRILFDHYFPILYRKIYSRISDQDTTNDLVQEVFIALWHARHKIDQIQSIDHYLSGIAKNLLHQYYRQQQRNLVDTTPYSEELSAIYRSDSTPETDLRTKEALSLIEQLVEQMPDTMRKCFRLFYHEKYTVDDICKQLGLSEQTVKNHLSVAKQRIKNAVPHIAPLLWLLF